MSLRTIRRDLVLEVRAARNAVVFNKAKASVPAFTTFDAVDDLVAALSDDAASTIAGREQIVAAILVEHRARPHALWSALLLIAYTPMLGRLASRVRADDEEEQAIFVAFLDAARRVAAEPGRIAIRLRCMTQEAVFRALGRESRRDEVHVEIDDARDEPLRCPAPVVRNLRAADVVDELVDGASAASRNLPRTRRGAKTRGAGLRVRPALASPTNPTAAALPVA
jgi:hypothetical protein